MQHSLHHTTIVKAIQDLNPAVLFDDGIKFHYLGAPHGQRSGLSYQGKHIANLELGDIPEMNELGDVGDALFPVHPTVALRKENYYDVITYQIVAEITSPLFLEAHLQMEKKTVECVSVGGYDVMAERVMVELPDGSQDHGMLLRLYLKRCSLPYTVTKIGWRESLERILNAKIPNVTRTLLGQKLGVDLSYGKRRDNKTLEEMVQEATS